jgi:HPt (histidine-containing phosphotransfer) domain-containing protein
MLSRRVRAPDGAPHGGGASTDAALVVLDPAALARLSELDPTGSNQLVQRVLQAFQTSVARLRPQAEAARLTRDHSAIRLVAHTLKSSSASIGALALSALCAHIEAQIRSDPGADQGANLDALGVALDEALRAIELQLKGPA